jgi:hypothetical protein
LQFIGNFQETTGAKSGWGAGKYMLMHVDDKLYNFILIEFKIQYNNKN